MSEILEYKRAEGNCVYCGEFKQGYIVLNDILEKKKGVCCFPCWNKHEGKFIMKEGKCTTCDSEERIYGVLDELFCIICLQEVLK